MDPARNRGTSSGNRRVYPLADTMRTNRPPGSGLSRRRLITTLTGATAAALLPKAGPASDRSVQLDSPARLLEAYQRLSGSLDDRLVIWWMSGTRYGVVDAKSRALYGMEVGMFHHWYRQDDGGFKAAFFELTYYSNPVTGELLREFQNPYTGKTNTVRHVRLGPEIRILTTEGLRSPDNPMVKNYRSSLGPAVVNGNSVWVPTSVEATIKFPKPTAPEILLNIYTTVQGNLDDALNEALVSAPCSFEFHNVLKWEPWMQMGDHPGHMMSTASGRKLESVNELPERYRAMAEEVHGKYIADPTAAMQRQLAELRS